MYTYIHTRHVSQFSKGGFFHTVENRREEGPKLALPVTSRYRVTRRKLDDDGEIIEGTAEIVQDNLTTEEIIRYLSHCAEDGSMMK